MSWWRHTVALLAYVLVAAPVHAQAPQATDDEVLEEVVVVGTRRGAISTQSLAVPVDVLDAEELSGQGDVLDVLTARVPSYNVNREPISDAATLVRPANLRGLPADSTLILVNGKRRHRGAVIGEFVSGINKGAQGVDIVPLIPIALQRVEVLRDGASAQYGSDAIAGVINFVLEDDPDVRRLQLQYGSTYVGDGDRITAAGSFGTRLGRDGFATVSAELKDSKPTSRGSQDPQATYLVENGYTNVADPVVIWGAPEVRNDFKVILNGGVEAGVGELYGFGGWSGRDVDGSFFYRNPNTRSGVFAGTDGNLLVADLMPDDDVPCRAVPVIDGLAVPEALNEVIDGPNCFVYNEWFPSGFTPRFGGEVADSFVTGGWRGARGDLEYDFSVSAGRNELIYRIRNTVNASYGPNSPTAFDLGAQTNFERLVNVDFVLPVDVGAASDLNVAFGAQYHEETFDIVAGDTESWAPGGFENQGFSVGSNGFQGFNADVAGRFGRNSYSAYVDLEVDVTDAWLVSGALRYEEFSDFGDTANGKLVTRYDFTDRFALRAAASTGFRAPSIGQSSLKRAATVVVDGRLAESLTLPPTDPVAMLKGGRQLRPEESVNLSLGAVFSLGAVNVSVDWFQIDVDDRIALTQLSLSDRDRADLLDANIIGAETVTAVSFFVNDIRSETTGVDLVVDSGFDWAGGRANITVAGNVTRTNILERGRCRMRRSGKLKMPFRTRVWPSPSTMRAAPVLRLLRLYEHLFNCETCAITTDALSVFDAEVSWAVSSTYSLALGIQNLFDCPTSTGSRESRATSERITRSITRAVSTAAATICA